MSIDIIFFKQKTGPARWRYRISLPVRSVFCQTSAFSILFGTKCGYTVFFGYGIPAKIRYRYVRTAIRFFQQSPAGCFCSALPALQPTCVCNSRLPIILNATLTPPSICFNIHNGSGQAATAPQPLPPQPQLRIRRCCHMGVSPSLLLREAP